MSVSKYEVRSSSPPRAEAWPLPSTDVAARRIMNALVGVERPGSLHKALQRLGGDWLRRQQLGALAWWRWRGSSDCPLDVTLDLQTAWYAAAGDTELHRHELSDVLQVLTAHDITPVVFKGAALAYSVYPDPICRTMSDLDLWVTVDAMDRAREALIAAGYVSRSKFTRPQALMESNSGEVQLYGTRQGAGLVELHFGVFAGEWLRRAASVDETAIWQHARTAAVAGQPTRVLDLADSLIQVAVHFAINHNASQPWLRALVDVTFLARHQPLDWPVVVQRARAWRVATATWLVLSLAVDLCGLNEAADAVHQLAPSRLRQKLIGRFANAQALVDMRDLSKSKWRYVYLLLMVDRKRAAVKLVYRALWPETEWLRARYGQSGWRTRLRHVFDAARGRI